MLFGLKCIDSIHTFRHMCVCECSASSLTVAAAVVVILFVFHSSFAWFCCCLRSFGTHLCLSRRQYNFEYLFLRTFRTFSAVNVNSVNVEWTLSISQIEYIFFVAFFTQSPFHNQFYFIFVLIHLSSFFGRMIEERNTLYWSGISV